MELRVKEVYIGAGGKNVAVLNYADASELDVRPLEKVKISFRGKEVIAIVDISERVVERGEIGLFLETLEALGAKEMDIVEVVPCERLASTFYIRKKLEGRELKEDEVMEIVRDIVGNRLSEIEIAYFVAATFTKKMSLKETYFLTKAIVETGKRLKLNKYPVLSKHSIGGICGNRISLIIVPTIASLGYTIPKTASKAITSPSGTADTMEVLANVSFGIDELKEIIEKVNACIVWGGSLDIAPADDKIIRIENPLMLDPRAQMSASILAKHIGVGTTHLILDLPTGREAKLKSYASARKFLSDLKWIGKKFNLKLDGVITRAREPIGNGIGPALEARDCLLILENRLRGNLREKAKLVGCRLLNLVGVELRRAQEMFERSIEKGKALKKFREIIEAQGGDPNIRPEDIEIGGYTYDVKARKRGKISHLDDNSIAILARLAGSPKDKGAGVYLHKHLGEKVKKGDKILTIYAESERKLTEAIRFLRKEKRIVVIR